MVLAATLAAMALLAGTKYTLDLRHEREQAEKARLESEQVSDFLINLFNVSDPEESAGEVITARELLDEGATRIDQELVDQPSVRARLKTTIGKVYLKLGLFEPARQQLQLSLAIIEANGLLHTPVHVQILSALGMLETETNDYAAAEAWYEKATAAFRQSPEAGEKSLLDIKDGLAMIYARTDRLDQALELNQEVLVATLAAAEPKFLDIANAYNNVGLQFWRKQQLQQAEDHMRLALDSLHQADRGDLALEATLLGNLALILSDQGELVESAQMAQTTVQIREQIYGESHPSLALAYDNLAVSQFRAGLLDDAEASNLKALDLYAETYGKKHADYAWTLANRAVILREKGDLDGSVLALLDVIDIMQTALGKNHTGVAENQSKLSTVYLLQGRPADALSSSEGAVATYKASQVEMSLYVSRSWFQLAHLQQQMGEFAAAKLTLQDLLSRLEQVADMDPAIAKQVTEALDELSALTGQ
jgi:tetratricopeptide (TPR) repeat protein